MNKIRTRYNQEIDVLHEISYLLGRAKSNSDMYRIAVEQSINNLDIDRLAIFLIIGPNKVQGTYGTDVVGNVVDESWFTSTIDAHTFASKMIQDRTFINFQYQTSLLHNFTNVGEGWNGYVTLWDGSEPIGWIACDNLLSSSPLKASQVNILEMLGFIISQNIVRRKYQGQLVEANQELAVKNRELEYLTAKLEQQVFIDPLTQVANRRALKRYLDNIYADKENHHLSLSILMLDIDNFKQINDRYGHLDGDQCLQSVARHLKNSVSGNNHIFARYGGEEFTFAFLDLTQEKLEQIVENILGEVRELKIDHPSLQSSHSVTVSIGGIFASTLQDVNYIELIKCADQALYRAKQHGKDQSIIGIYSLAKTD